MSTLQQPNKTVESYPEVGVTIQEDTTEVRVLVDERVRQSWTKQQYEDTVQVAELWVNGFIYGTD